MTLKSIKTARTLKDLANACKSVSRTLNDDVNELSKRVALLLVQRLVYETPVDTSQALSNWQVSVKYKARGTVPAHEVGKKGSTRQQSAASTLMEAYGVIQSKKYGQALHVTNNLGYIVELNQGKSKQADALFIDVIEAQVQLEADKLLREKFND